MNYKSIKGKTPITPTDYLSCSIKWKPSIFESSKKLFTFFYLSYGKIKDWPQLPVHEPWWSRFHPISGMGMWPRPQSCREFHLPCNRDQSRDRHTPWFRTVTKRTGLFVQMMEEEMFEYTVTGWHRTENSEAFFPPCGIYFSDWSQQVIGRIKRVVKSQSL